MEKVHQLTKAGYEELEKEKDQLINVRRKEVSEKIKVAREQGDLSENAEYDEAKDEQRDIEARIAEIDNILKTAEIIGEEKGSKNKISVGCTVKVLDIEFDEEDEYRIVGSIEADSLKGKISNESPLGKAIMGKKKGDIVDVVTDAGEVIQYKIIDFKKD